MKEMKYIPVLKLFFTFFLINSFYIRSYSQVTVEFRLTADAGNQGLNGTIRLCNNSGGPLPAPYSIRFRWPSLNGFDYGPATVRNGTGSCDTWTFTFQSWQLPANGSCMDISSGKSNGAYTAPLRYPAYGISQFGDTVNVVVTSASFIPKSYNQSNWQYSFDPNCFIPSPSSLCLGESQLREWNALWDVRVPTNRKSWALVSAHISTLFNNMVGAQVVSMNYAFAQSMIEGRMGCDAGFSPPVGDNNPLSSNPGSVSAGCFQILAPGWAQLQQYYPSLINPLNYSNIIPGNHYVTAALAKVLYDMTTFAKYEKMNCANPIGFFVGSADQYAAEEILAYAYHEGPNGSESALLNLLVTNRATTINNNNVAKYLQQNFGNASTQYSERMRNNLIQLENNFTIPGGNSRLSTEAQTNWVGGSPPTGYEWHGCYNETFTWTEISNYIDEAATLFWTANVPNVKTKAQAAFNALNGGSPVVYSNLGPVIDAIVLAFPAYSPDEGIGKNFFASACGSPSVTLSSCDEICPPGSGELWVHLMGTAPFAYTIEGPCGLNITRTNVMKATDKIRVPQPGTYKVTQIQDAIGNVFLNCNSTAAIIKQPSACALPVTFTNFNANVIALKKIELNWSTSDEINSKHFLIQRKKANSNYETIGQITASGLSNTLKHYNFFDEHPGAGTNYYRILSLDLNGAFSYSKIVAAEIITVSDFLIVPNPNNGQYQIELMAIDDKQESTIEIIDLNGKIVRSFKAFGSNIFDDHIQPGMYVVNLIADSNQLHKRMVVTE